ncbi:MAG: DUF2188 domain-containing protein [Pseudomonadota bacterium]
MTYNHYDKPSLLTQGASAQYFLVEPVVIFRTLEQHSEAPAMSVTIYVGNLSLNADEEELKDLFERYGEVASARIVSDPSSGRAWGFGIVEMEGRDEGLRAIQDLNSQVLHGRPLKVSEAPPRIESNTVHIISRTGQWAVKREGAATALKVFPTKEAATGFADQLLEDSKATEIVVHRKDGSVAARRRSGQRDRPVQVTAVDTRAISQ